ncbi:MAG: HD domain-containing protein [Rhizobium sp.]|nr:HD domain-containing protein [Rhizobium sp.]
MSDLDMAIEVAVDAHRNQYDKNGEPYILHPLRVMLALDAETDRIVGVLHDVVEDCVVGCGPSIRMLFGDDVWAAVTALTRDEGESYEDFIVRAKANPIARRVKIADINDNLRPGAEHLRPRYERALAVLQAD